MQVPHVRRPVAAALCDNARLLCVVNHRSGTVSLIDTASLEVTGEFRLGQRLSDIAVLPDGNSMLITDEARHELLVVRLTREGIEVVDRIATPRSPVNVTVSPDGRHAAVACQWSHRVMLLNREDHGWQAETSGAVSRTGDLEPDVSDQRPPVSESHAESPDLDGETMPPGSHAVRLPFAPRLQLFVSATQQPAPTTTQSTLPDDHEDGGTSKWRLIVADAFGGRLAVVNPETGDIESVRQLPAHNIRGLATSADGARLLISHQALSPLAHTDFEDVHWGSLIQNLIRDLSVTAVLEPTANLLDGSRRIRLGQTGNAAADPAAIAVLDGIRQERVESGPLAVALSGVGEIVTMTSSTQRTEVGARPLDVVWDSGQRRIYTVCSIDDLITVVDVGATNTVTPIPLGPRGEASPRERGERLFYDGRRSHDGWMSCHSCHTDGHTNGGLADTLSDGAYDTPKQIPSLLGTR
ncbi:MAG: hypothetical protein KF861_24035, partial [Planctomycetaceae bacterium]|nr:hypothetical protein [Planctomycetaceae bacterium]